MVHCRDKIWKQKFQSGMFVRYWMQGANVSSFENVYRSEICMESKRELLIILLSIQNPNPEKPVYGRKYFLET